eukprot:CAMPEP_0116027428 /NCGR_PEP_ID=MMETSP0321-20121206/14641_1 /TAXON_ID=163516 /ORGANISM="Leptocylindrus danicus var. danicus, Strain B650" /LENGTH=696 /DNA_ID=CAMNT_0003500817 /DNA_START=69 /DNA_END=2159 /DNA_ORIENTATION=+
MVSLAKTARSPKKKTSIGLHPKNKPKRTEEKLNAASIRKKKERKLAKQLEADDEDIYQEPLKHLVAPANQISLTDNELRVEITRVLTGDDPNRPRNISKFNFKDRRFKPDPPGQSDHMATHFTIAGCSLHRESSDYETQKKREDEKEAAEEKTRKAFIDRELSKENSCNETQREVETHTVDNDKNQFNYTERAAQTFNYPFRERGMCTEPPPVLHFSSAVSQWEIYDCYMNEHTNSSMEIEKLRKAENSAKPAAVTSGTEVGRDTVHSKHMARALKIMERLVNQNADDEIFQDFKYWEDASDQYRDGEGSLLPLWRFSTDHTKKKQVTALTWNPRHADLFAVGYGSYDFMRQGSGKICCFTLKNTSYPEYIFSTESGVMCLDFHPLYPSLLAVGCYDGSVLVYNVCNNGMRPIYSSSIRTGKHTDPVWQVSWHVDDMGKELGFFSISTDGKVAHWTMSKNELNMEPVMQLKLVQHTRKDEIEQETSMSGFAGGCCFDFNQKHCNLFIVGTEEGRIHKCSKAYSGQYLATYEGHHMPVYAVKWNPFHERVFLSCSADWTVKLWDHSADYPIMSFDLGCSVGDICWSPHSSTVFGAVTSDGRVHVYDLAENKHEPLCIQKVVKRAKLTHLSFSSQDYIIIVGDDRGGVNSLKLSPNLRKLGLPMDSGGSHETRTDAMKVQSSKMDKILLTADVKRTIA